MLLVRAVRKAPERESGSLLWRCRTQFPKSKISGVRRTRFRSTGLRGWVLRAFSPQFMVLGCHVCQGNTTGGAIAPSAAGQGAQREDAGPARFAPQSRCRRRYSGAQVDVPRVTVERTAQTHQAGRTGSASQRHSRAARGSRSQVTLAPLTGAAAAPSVEALGGLYVSVKKLQQWHPSAKLVHHTSLVAPGVFWRGAVRRVWRR